MPFIFCRRWRRRRTRPKRPKRKLTPKLTLGTRPLPLPRPRPPAPQVGLSTQLVLLAAHFWQPCESAEGLRRVPAQPPSKDGRQARMRLALSSSCAP
jgi:hypothetical protein